MSNKKPGDTQKVFATGRTERRVANNAGHGMDIPVVRRNLLAWYRKNRRDLPWRKTQDPYRIWISEVMLQQTRVQAAIPYYENFLRQFPSVEALASSKEEKLLACWSGLGYYSRARNLRRAAQQIVRDFDGVFPREAAMAESLPGVGPYTAAAVLSIACGVALPVLDGNVARVLSRLHARPLDLRTGKGKASLGVLAQSMLAPRRPGEFNQAMMELGATICLPANPNCRSCPVRSACRAWQLQRVDEFPPTRPKPSERRWSLGAAVVLNRARRLFLVQRPRDAQWLAGFWELPMWDAGLPSERSGNGSLFSPTDFDLKESMGRVRHTITVNRLDMEVFRARLRNQQRLSGGRWISPDELDGLAVSTITRKALRLLGRED